MIKTQDNSALDGKSDKIDGLGFCFFENVGSYYCFDTFLCNHKFFLVEDFWKSEKRRLKNVRAKHIHRSNKLSNQIQF